LAEALEKDGFGNFHHASAFCVKNFVLRQKAKKKKESCFIHKRKGSQKVKAQVKQDKQT
jgi:hypothetical protein